MATKTREELIAALIKYAADDYKEDQESFVEDCVDDAIQEVCNTMYPWDVSDIQMKTLKVRALKRYSMTIQRIAQFHYDKQGKEGVTTFYESGQTNSYGGGGTPKEYLDCIVPIAKVV